MRKLKKLNGAKVLSKKEQQALKGGGPGTPCTSDADCPSGQDCWLGFCHLNKGGRDEPR